MEVLKLLEEKIAGMLERILELKADNEQLSQENAQLMAKMVMLEKSLTSDISRIEELSEEKALTKMVVDDLIQNIERSIGSLVENQANGND